MTDIIKMAHSLAKARKANALSQKDLAQKLGMKQSQISDLETGKRDTRWSTLIEVARVLGLEVVLVPRHLLPVVSHFIEEPNYEDEQRSMYDLNEEDDDDGGAEESD